MASNRRGSEGDANKSKFSRSLSATRRLFRNNPTPEIEIVDDGPPITPDISINNRSVLTSPNDSQNSSDSESPSEISSKTQKKDKNKKIRKSRKTEKVENLDMSDYSLSLIHI